MFLKPKHFIFECRPNFGSFFPLPGLLRAITFSAPKPPLYKFLRTPLAVPIIRIDFMRHFGLGIDVVNNTFILPKTSMYRRHYLHCVSCPSANDAVELPFTSADTTDLTDQFPIEPCIALDTVNVDAAKAVAHFINDLPKNAVDSPIVNDDDDSSALQEPED